MNTSKTTFPIIAMSSYFKTGGTASRTLLSSANLKLVQGSLGAVWELAWAKDGRQLACGYPVFKEKTV